MASIKTAIFWKKQLYKSITLMSLPILLVIAIIAQPVILLIKMIIQLGYSIYHKEVLALLSFVFQRFIGLSVISYWQNNSGITKWLGTPLFFLKESFKRIIGLLVGNNFLGNIANNVELLLAKNLKLTTRINAFFTITFYVITAPFQILYSYPRRIMGAFLYNLILIGGFIPTKNFTNQQRNYESFVTKSYFLPNYLDGTSLETVELINKDNITKAPDKTAYIIRLQGNGMVLQYENNDPARNLYKKTGANVVFFNLRGVQKSSGLATSSWDLVSDGITQVKTLLSKGVANITLDGHSLGGGIATLVARHFQERGIKINVYNDRSFYKIGAFLTYPRSSSINPEADASTRKETDRSFFGVLQRCALKWLGCEMHAGRAAAQLEPETIAVAAATSDMVIPQCSSLYNYLYTRQQSIRERAKYDMSIYSMSYTDHMTEKCNLGSEEQFLSFVERCHRRPA